MSIFLYRWLPSTVLPNLWQLFKSIIKGITNVIRWTPVIWCDRDYDWEYLAEIMEYKLRRMSKMFTKYGWHLYGDRDVRRMLICAELLKRLIADDMDDLGKMSKANIIKHNDRMIAWQKMLGRYIGKYFTSWWD